MKILSIFLVFAIIFLSACGKKQELEEALSEVSTGAYQETQKNIGKEALIDHNSSLEKVFSLVPESIKEKQGFNLCVANNIDMCILEQAKISPESIKCEDYLVESNRILCNEQEKISHAKEKNDISICESLIENKYSCEYEVVLAKALLTGDPIGCSSLSDGYKIPCNNEVVRRKAITDSNPKICEDIISYVEGDVFEEDFCKEEVQFSIDEKKRLKDEQKAQTTIEENTLNDIEF